MKRSDNLTDEEFEALRIKHVNQVINGLKKGKVMPFSQELFEALRPYSYGGYPASLLIFTPELCNGFCYDRAELVSLAFDDCRIVISEIESLRAQKVDCADHCYVETEDNEGTTWIVDTSVGYFIRKDYFEKIEKPVVKKVVPKAEIMERLEIQILLAENFEDTKWNLVHLMPIYELVIKNSNDLFTSHYRETIVAKEIEYFKQKVNYDELVREERENMRMMLTDPDGLDKKLGIVRDNRGVIVSRNGVPEPFYTSPEEYERYEQLDAGNTDIENGFIDFDNERWMAIAQKSTTDQETYERKIRERAKTRLAEIKLNPTANYFEQPSNNN